MNKRKNKNSQELIAITSLRWGMSEVWRTSHCLLAGKGGSSVDSVNLEGKDHLIGSQPRRAGKSPLKSLLSLLQEKAKHLGNKRSL